MWLCDSFFCSTNFLLQSLWPNLGKTKLYFEQIKWKSDLIHINKNKCFAHNCEIVIDNNGFNIKCSKCVIYYNVLKAGSLNHVIYIKKTYLYLRSVHPEADML